MKSAWIRDFLFFGGLEGLYSIGFMDEVKGFLLSLCPVP